jgi:hypothetical protein
MTLEQHIKNSYRCEACGLEYQYYGQCPICLCTSNITPDLTVNKRKHYPPIMDIVDTNIWLLKWKIKNKIRHYQRELNKIK